MLTLSDLQLCAQVAALAVVFSDILTRPKMLLERYGYWLERLETTRPRIAYPMGYCAKCTGGQIGLWSFLIYRSEDLAYAPGETAFRIVCAISVVILFSALLSRAVASLTR